MFPEDLRHVAGCYASPTTPLALAQSQTTKQACPHDLTGHRPPGISAVVTSPQEGAPCSFELKVRTCTNSHVSMYFHPLRPKPESEWQSIMLSQYHPNVQAPDTGEAWRERTEPFQPIRQYGHVYIIKERGPKLPSYFKLITPFMSITWQAGSTQSEQLPQLFQTGRTWPAWPAVIFPSTTLLSSAVSRWATAGPHQSLR